MTYQTSVISKKYPQDIVTKALELYASGMLATEVATALSIPYSTVGAWIRGSDVVRSLSDAHKLVHAKGIISYDNTRNRFLKYPVDEQAFVRELTPETAWLLGVIVGDGCIMRPGGVVRALDVAGEYDVCDKARKILKSESPIVKQGGCYRVKFCSTRLAKSLAKYGVVPKKSYITVWPELHENLYPHFTRGFFDSDGSVSKGFKRRTKANGQEYLIEYICLSASSCSYTFMTGLCRMLNKITGSAAKPIGGKRSGGKELNLNLSCRVAREFGEWIYSCSEEHMRNDRKYARFMELKSLGTKSRSSK